MLLAFSSLSTLARASEVGVPKVERDIKSRRYANPLVVNDRPEPQSWGERRYEETYWGILGLGDGAAQT